MKKKDIEKLYKVKDLLPKELVSTTFNMSFRRFIRIADLCLKYVPPPASILDAGCGVGSFALMMKELGYKVTCIDHPNVEDHPWLLENGIPVKKINLEEQEIPFDSETFDLVTCLDVIEHLHGSPKNMIKEFNRILSKGGFLFVEAPNCVHLGNRLKVLFGQTNYDSLNYFYNSGYPYRSHIREYTPSEIKKILQWSQFTVVKVKTFNTVLDYTRGSRISSGDSAITEGYKYEYEAGFKLNSTKAMLLLIFVVATMLWANFRQMILGIARKERI